MKPRITLVTLGVDDLPRAVAFYRDGLGWKTEGIVSSREEVDAVLREAQRAGAIIVKPGKEAFWGGYTGYFQDPDGHLWEVAWNPQMQPQE
jgi:hypothetical protein